ncbi:MAG TPA: TlpA disulfide reductase family protein [Puia sp.]|nr:TlpA disulfide reductase family protein [Puia sp.]
MRFILHILLLCILTATTYGQDDPPPAVSIGDPAPALRVRAWLKGAPIQQFEKGRVYVLEFWATWCAPCRAAMPHLSELARAYNGKATFVGIDIYEEKTMSLEKIKHFVDSIGSRMDYNAAADDSNFMAAEWLDSTREKGIPKTFVVNADGRLAWIGHPKDLEPILPQIVNNKWDIQAALAQKNLQRRLDFEDEDDNFELAVFKPNSARPNAPDRPDSMLLAIAKFVEKEPGLKYAPSMAYNTFTALLKTDTNRAYTYAKEVMASSYFGEPSVQSIIWPIEVNADKLTIPAMIYRLGAEAYQVYIGQFPYPELVNIPNMYHHIADFYWRAGDRSKAIEAEEKAIDTLKKRKGSAKDLTAYESQLRQYRDR